MYNQTALDYWQSTGYDDDAVRRVWDELEQRRIMAAMVDLTDQGTFVTLSGKVVETRQGHYPFILKFLKRFAHKFIDTDFSGVLIFLLEDGMWDTFSSLATQVPIFSFGKSTYDHCTFLIPDPAFLDSEGYLEQKEKIRTCEEKYPWHKKRRKVFWRGANSGLHMGSERWQEEGRVRLAMATKRINNHDFLDAYISKVIEADDPIYTDKVRDAGLVKEYVPLEEFFKYRYLISIDGMHCAWCSTFTFLSSKSTVFKVESNLQQWYYARLKPWKHYIPVRPDLADLQEKIQWAFDHEEHCQTIAETASSLMAELTFDNVSDEFEDLVLEVLKLHDGHHSRLDLALEPRGLVTLRE